MLFGNLRIPDPDDPDTEIPYGAQLPQVDVDERLAAIIRDPILQWRCKVFLDLGMTMEQARHLALDKNADTNLARKLIRGGCEPAVAFDIVS